MTHKKELTFQLENLSLFCREVRMLKLNLDIQISGDELQMRGLVSQALLRFTGSNP